VKWMTPLIFMLVVLIVHSHEAFTFGIIKATKSCAPRELSIRSDVVTAVAVFDPPHDIKVLPVFPLNDAGSDVRTYRLVETNLDFSNAIDFASVGRVAGV
jgi:hypothetical protein